MIQTINSDIQKIFQAQKENRWRVANSTAAQRIEKLLRLKKEIQNHSAELEQAFQADYRKPALEVQFTEIFPAFEEINFAVRHLKSWMKPRKVKTPVTLVGVRTEIHYEAKGQVLIMSPWNYPFNLLICPLVAAIAAGNTVILRPSNKVPQVSAVIAKIIKKSFPENEVALFLGDSAIADQLLELPFDHIFFTGSTRIGQKIMQAASKHLASVTLELGGKSPVIVAEDADLDLTVNRLVWGKYLNGGQTCIAPDYVFVHRSRIKELEEKILQRISKVYGSTDSDREKNPDYTHIVDQHSIDRLQNLVTKSRSQGAQLLAGGTSTKESRYFAPTVLTEVKTDHEVMSEEIFGPILPLLPYDQISEVISHIQNNPKPLALYVFTNNNKLASQVLSQTSSGGAVVNHLLIHFANHNVPFGGIGASGQGSYHGIFGFKTFSHEKAVLKQSKVSLVRFFYPPYKGKLAQTALRLLRFMSH